MGLFRSMNLSSSIGRFRWIALLEGISFLVLLGIAMPVKYILGFPILVKYVGWAHGLLFVLYGIGLVQCAAEYSWGFNKIVIAFVASLVPFGTFWLDKQLKEEA